MRFVMVLAALAACNGDKDDGETGDTGADTDTDDTDTDDTDVADPSFTITGTALDIQTRTPAAEGLCLELLDPTPVLSGQPAELLQETTVGAAGAFTFADVVTDSTLGLLLSLKDCDTEGATVYTTATGILPESYNALEDGATLADQTAFSISNTMLEGLELSAQAVGYLTDLSDDGFLFGFALDAGRQPLSGVTVTCDGCTTWYLDADPTDGLFSTGADLNVSTDAAAGGAWLIPAAPVGSFTADDGGVHSFAPQLNGSNPGSATATAFIAQ